MGFLDDLLKGGRQRQDYDDFVSRYDQGHPSEGYSDQEVVQRYREVAHQVHQTPGRLSGLLGAGGEESGSQSAGSGMAGMLSSPLAKAALAGIAAMVVRKAMNR